MNFVTLVLLIAPLAPIFAQSPGEPPPLYAYRVLRLQTNSIPGITEELGCRTPAAALHHSAAVHESQGERDPGPVLKPGQTDWAVLCSKPGSTSLLLFWNGSATNSAALAKNPDKTERIDWFIRPVDWKFIIDHYRAYGGPKPPPIDHQGIESGGDSASVVLYYYGGKRLKLQGAD